MKKINKKKLELNSFDDVFKELSENNLFNDDINRFIGINTNNLTLNIVNKLIDFDYINNRVANSFALVLTNEKKDMPLLLLKSFLNSDFNQELLKKYMEYANFSDLSIIARSISKRSTNNKSFNKIVDKFIQLTESNNIDISLLVLENFPSKLFIVAKNNPNLFINYFSDKPEYLRELYKNQNLFDALDDSVNIFIKNIILEDKNDGRKNKNLYYDLASKNNIIFNLLSTSEIANMFSNEIAVTTFNGKSEFNFSGLVYVNFLQFFMYSLNYDKAIELKESLYNNIKLLNSPVKNMASEVVLSYNLDTLMFKDKNEKYFTNLTLFYDKLSENRKNMCINIISNVIWADVNRNRENFEHILSNNNELFNDINKKLMSYIENALSNPKKKQELESFLYKIKLNYQLENKDKKTKIKI